MQKVIRALPCALALIVLAMGGAVAQNSSRIHATEHGMRLEVDGTDGIATSSTNDVLELKQSKVYLNGKLMYTGKGRVLAQYDIEASKKTLTVNGKVVGEARAKPE